jgi:hypothetical protein
MRLKYTHALTVYWRPSISDEIGSHLLVNKESEIDRLVLGPLSELNHYYRFME